MIFLSCVGVPGSRHVELQTISQVAAQCGENVTLTCDAKPSGQLKIFNFIWLAKNKSLCQYPEGQTSPEVLCESTDQSPHHSLTLTLLNVMPVDEGTYLCKLQSDLGAPSEKTVVTVQDCLGSFDSSINESHAECWFSGVYPSGTIFWFQGDVNLTDPAGTREEVNHLGLYNVSSTIDIQKGNLSQPYTCSLWIASARKPLWSQQLPVVEKQTGSSGSMVNLQWICVMVEIMMVKCMT
ncbi:cell adhesion molecule 3-like isoform X2 [Sander vitreus]